jgi:SAM domain (Sterile alpha motif)
MPLAFARAIPAFAARRSRGLIMDVVVWLRSLGLEKYEAAFRENEIDETVLPGLTAEDLKELGVAALGHRRKLLDAIAALRAVADRKAPSAGAATSSAPNTSPERLNELRLRPKPS